MLVGAQLLPKNETKRTRVKDKCEDKTPPPKKKKEILKRRKDASLHFGAQLKAKREVLDTRQKAPSSFKDIY
ncbi:hypothetical protein CEXT_550821 [Caerostris extrusa]|uniref:Uncharacterized protein n=1 Tax=Caerostris extrusa TaxID=172846 RepID=A0AAV4V7D5_CAEEX|nr:hypothetical protein CEXT_550821 [Caerostris extrusa]